MKARVIAYYLPQFHPIPENDLWWGEGFTEWTNVKKAKPLFNGHIQPKIPTDLGYYDLRDPSVRQAQAEMARQAGIEGFCYWHYWFGNGKRLLERPFDEVLASGEPGLPFCLGWANESWSGIWHGASDKILMEQTYPGEQDYIDHFNFLLRAFQDPRYIRIDDKPLLVVYRPLNSEKIKAIIPLWRKLAVENGLPGIHFVGHTHSFEQEKVKILEYGFDSVTPFRLSRASKQGTPLIYRWLNKLGHRLLRSTYKATIRNLVQKSDADENVMPSIIPRWDNSPRSGKRARIIEGSTPELFDQHVKQALALVETKKNKIVFLKSWNEWAEGNYVEPDTIYGRKYLEVLRRNLL
jgi:lipopolysaccharide biosynthesis protein